MKKYSNIIAIIVSLIVIFGAGFGAVSYFAKASEVKELVAEVSYRFLEIRAKDLQDKMWAYEDRYSENKAIWPKEKIRKWKEWKAEYEKIQKKLEIIFAQQKKRL